MNVLLDTCALLALASGELPDGAAAALRTAPEAWVSVVSPWEVAIKAAAGKLQRMEPAFVWFLTGTRSIACSPQWRKRMRLPF